MRVAIRQCSHFHARSKQCKIVVGFDPYPRSEQLIIGEQPQGIHGEKQADKSAGNDEITNDLAQKVNARPDRTLVPRVLLPG